MRRILVGVMVFSVVMPMMAFAQTQPTCEQRLAVMGQIVEDMSRARALVTTAEVEAASLKVQVKTMQGELEAGKKKVETEKKTEERKAE